VVSSRRGGRSEQLPHTKALQSKQSVGASAGPSAVTVGLQREARLGLHFIDSTPALQRFPGKLSTGEEAAHAKWGRPAFHPRAFATVSFDDGRAPWSTSAWAPSRQPDSQTESKRKAFRILIADDHEAIRRGLRSALSGAGWQICGEALDGREAIRQTTALRPDLVILDISMPVLGGLEAAREILRSGGGTKVLIFTMHESRQIRAETAALGVHGIAVKSAPLSTLLATIESILRPS
jgi:CheY-like chemotaxis protein